MQNSKLDLLCFNCPAQFQFPFQGPASFSSYSNPSHWAFMMAICFWEATFIYKCYHLSDCYRLYISCKTIKEKPRIIKLIFQTGISCISVAKITLKQPSRYPTIRSIFISSLAVVIVSLININNWPYLGINNFQLMNQIRTLA